MRLPKSFFKPITLASALVLIFILSMGLATTVSASPVISISPNSGPENVWVVVNGSGYTPNVELYFVVEDTASGLATPQGYYYADSSGSFSVSIHLLSFSGFLGGPWLITVRDTYTGVYSNNSYYTITMSPPTGARVTHAVISIDGNDNFTVGNGVNGGGSGTLASPYIIENWAISAASDNGISIKNTTSYFIIRNCLVENGQTAASPPSGAYTGVALNNVINGRIEYNVFENNKRGVYLLNSDYDNITNNSFGVDHPNGHNNIYLSYCDYNLIANNLSLATSETGSDGIVILWKSYYNLIINNTCSSNTDSTGITLNGGREADGTYAVTEGGTMLGTTPMFNTVAANTVGGTGFGIFMTGADNSAILNNLFENTTDALFYSANLYVQLGAFDNIIGNTVSNGDSYGIYLVNSENNRLEYNTAENNGHYGIFLDSRLAGCPFHSSRNVITANTSENNTYGIYLATATSNNIITFNHLTTNSTNNGYDAGTNFWFLSGVGNYWSDWQTPDVNGNGIVDTPRTITGGSNADSYPLVLSYTPPVSPTLSINPPSGAVGTTVTFTGAGFTPSGSAYIRVGDSYHIGWLIVNVSASGTFSQTYVIHDYDNTYFYAIDYSTAIQSNTVSFTKTGDEPGLPTISVNPLSGTNNEIINILGSGFTPLENVYIRFSNLPGIPYALLGVSNSVGSFNLFYRIPGAALVGTLYFGAFDFGTSILSNVIAYNVTAQENINSSIYITPNTGTVGQKVSVFGDNFSMTTTLYIYFDNTLIWNAVTGHLGTFVEEITIPTSTVGAHNITVYDPQTHAYSNIEVFTVIAGPTTTTPPYGGENGTIDLIGLVAPLVGGDRTIAGIAIGSVGVMFFAIIGLGIIAGGRSKEYANLILLVFALLGIFVVTIAGFYPWWILISLLAIITFILAFK